jgi:hypothetical protein
MIPFKFLQDNNKDEDEDDAIELFVRASWIYGRIEDLTQYQYDIVEEYHYGIHSLLNYFPPNHVVTILTITGPSGRVHNQNTEYDDGWGFDITSDLIRIEWVRFRP